MQNVLIAMMVLMFSLVNIILIVQQEGYLPMPFDAGDRFYDHSLQIFCHLSTPLIFTSYTQVTPNHVRDD